MVSLSSFCYGMKVFFKTFNTHRGKVEQKKKCHLCSYVMWFASTIWKHFELENRIGLHSKSVMKGQCRFFRTSDVVLHLDFNRWVEPVFKITLNWVEDVVIYHKLQQCLLTEQTWSELQRKHYMSVPFGNKTQEEGSLWNQQSQFKALL